MDCGRRFSRRAAPCCSSGLSTSSVCLVRSRSSSRYRHCVVGKPLSDLNRCHVPSSGMTPKVSNPIATTGFLRGSNDIMTGFEECPWDACGNAGVHEDLQVECPRERARWVSPPYVIDRYPYGATTDRGYGR